VHGEQSDPALFQDEVLAEGHRVGRGEIHQRERAARQDKQGASSTLSHALEGIATR
jgi:hypothetical protein